MKWTTEEIEYLKSEYAKLDGKKVANITEKIANELGKTKSSVRNKAYELGITHKERLYTNEQIQFLKDNIDKMTYADMAIILGKENSNVYRKCKQLGIIKTIECQSKIAEVKPKYKFTKEDNIKAIKAIKERNEKYGHPRGYLGHKHSPKTREKLSQAGKRAWEQLKGIKLEEWKKHQRETRIKNGTLNPMINQEKPYSRAKGGRREDLDNQYFRSAWEANIARYYNYLGIKWEYEPKTFIFENITRGSVSYTPDFYLPETDQWVEVKGWMDSKSKTKLKRFAEQYPEESKKLILIQEKEYNEIKRKISSFIKDWE
jgi:hypothetical protein